MVLADFKKIDKDNSNFQLLLAVLDVLRKSRFATSDKVNEISKLGLMMPKDTSEVDYDAETETE